MTKPEVLAIIPARGGSKGIPRKNIRPFAGYSFDCLQHRRWVASRDRDTRACIDRRRRNRRNRP